MFLYLLSIRVATALSKREINERNGSKVNEKQNKFRYIYNPNQAAFYITNKCELVATGKHEKTKNRYYMFYKDGKLNETEGLWNERSKEGKYV